MILACFIEYQKKNLSDTVFIALFPFSKSKELSAVVKSDTEEIHTEEQLNSTVSVLNRESSREFSQLDNFPPLNEDKFSRSSL